MKDSLPFNKNLLWDPNQWIPQLVVINLGTNDFGLGVPNQAGFNSAYINLIKHIREQYPDAHIYCALGPVLGGYNLKRAREFIASVVRRFDSSGDPNVHFIEFPPQDGSNGYGEDWHPSAKTHQLMADQLVRQLKADLDW